MSVSPPRPSGLLRGSGILTLQGEVAAEALPIGAVLVGVSGQAPPYSPLRLKRITRHDLAARPWARPLRIRADAIDTGVPMADLLVGPGQNLFIDGALVPAWRLADGAGIAPEPGVAEAVFVRLALDGQDAVLANGLAVATDADIRDAGTSQPPCAPDMDDMTLGLLLARLRLRAEEMGWAVPAAPPAAPVRLGSQRELWLASARLAPFGPTCPERFGDGEAS